MRMRLGRIEEYTVSSAGLCSAFPLSTPAFAVALLVVRARDLQHSWPLHPGLVKFVDITSDQLSATVLR